MKKRDEQASGKVYGWQFLLLALMIAVFHATPALAEAYVGGNIGGSFAQRLSNINGNENVNYPDPPQSTYPFTNGNGGSALFPNTHFTRINLQGTVFGGPRVGYFFKRFRGLLGVEFENNYSGPSFPRQNVTLSNAGFADSINGLGLGQNNLTEQQSFARGRLFTFAWNGILRYKRADKPNKLVPYVGFGPALYVLNVSGTGHSGVTLQPSSIADPFGVDGPHLSQTNCHVGLNFKVGVLYPITKRWSAGAEYHYNWSPIHIGHFRSASELKAGFRSNSFSFVLQRTL